MPRENIATLVAARFASIPFRLFSRRTITPPNKALILKPCCLSQAILTTPLLAALHTAYPNARIDWAISDWARPAIAGNPRVREFINTGPADLKQQSWREIYQLVQEIRSRRYDTCFIPSRSGLLSLIAWWAGIPQRIGLNMAGRGFAHTMAVSPTALVKHEAHLYLALAEAMGIGREVTTAVSSEFYPSDMARTAVTHRLVELDWLADAPLVVLHPGGGQNPVQPQTEKRWPLERFILLANRLIREYQARVMVVGDESDRPLVQEMISLMPVPANNLAGQLNLGELGALCEVADLYIGGDTGPTHIAAAVACPTIAIFGPSHPAISSPYTTKGKLVTLWHETPPDTPFSWKDGVSVEEVAVTAARFL